jgi:hypothetical protein
MRVKYFLLIVFTIIGITAKTQNRCPLGYEERNVKCGKEIITKCVPVNYSCSQCWAVITSPCPGFKTAGTEFFSSYENAYKRAEKDKAAALKSSNYNCIGADPRDYIIYLDDSKFCSTSSSEVSNNNGTNKDNGTSQTSNSRSSITSQNSQEKKANIQQEIDKIKSTFYTVSYTKALSKLGTIKQANPHKANEYQNNYGSKINYYEQIFSKEFDKGDNANPAILRQYIRELDNLVETMGLTADTDKQSNENQKQQYQNQANNYLNQAQNTNQSAISQQLNLDLAKTNAIMAGNTQQVQQINEMQRVQQNKSNDALINFVGDLVSQSLQNSLNNRLAAYKEFKEISEQLGATMWNYQKMWVDDFEKGNIKSAYENLYAATFLAVERAYNAKEFRTQYVLGKYSDATIKDYLFSVGDPVDKYEHLELPLKMPTLLNASFLNCYRERLGRSQIYDEAFSLLRDCDKSTITFRGNSYKIKCSGKKTGFQNEDSALARLKEVVSDPPASTPIDVFDYLHAVAWIAYLQTKKATTISDLTSNLTFLLEQYFLKYDKILNPTIQIKHSNYFNNIYERIIQYYFVFNLYRFSQNLSETNAQELSKILNVFKEIRNPSEPDDISTYYYLKEGTTPHRSYETLLKLHQGQFSTILEQIKQISK